jgi:hypothetical protein
MAETIRKVAYFKMKTADKPGEAARILGALRDEGVNLLAFSGFPRGTRAQLDFIAEDSDALKEAAKKEGLTISEEKSGFLIQGEDHVGAIADIVSLLGNVKINITAINAICAGEGRYGAILWVKPSDVEKAAEALLAT